ncbi:MAG: glucose 1-dehydrogenase [Clostridia bacterium]|nr:glucose 1-dehydrogenase [Clostridia bacterium]
MKTVLITGASRGIGKEIALKFAKNGYNVVINYNKSEKKALELADEISKMNVRVLTCKADVSDDSQVKLMVKKVVSVFGRIDVLVNNAGVALSKILQETKVGEIQKVFGINTFGTINCAKAVVPNMVSNKFGKIINISSIWGKVGASCETIYSASKGAVIAFTLALAKELAPSNISVNCVCPGVIETDMLKSYSDEDKKDLANNTPLQRLGTVNDVAEAVYFLASNEANFITGQVLVVDGGFVL